MNELKTEDVMRALECCANTACEDCPLDKQSHDCLDDLPKSALALLREKDAEIERLNDAVADAYEAARENTITEFAERLKAQECLPEYPWDEPFVLVRCIDQIANELKGGTI